MNNSFSMALDALKRLRDEGTAHRGRDLALPLQVHLTRWAEFTRLCRELLLTADRETRAEILRRSDRFREETDRKKNGGGGFIAVCEELCWETAGNRDDRQMWLATHAREPHQLLLQLPATLDKLKDPVVVSALGEETAASLTRRLTSYLVWADQLHLRGCEFLVLCRKLWSVQTSSQPLFTQTVETYRESFDSLLAAVISAAEMLQEKSNVTPEATSDGLNAKLRVVDSGNRRDNPPSTGMLTDATTQEPPGISSSSETRETGPAARPVDGSTAPSGAATSPSPAEAECEGLPSSVVTKRHLPGYLAPGEAPSSRLHQEPIRGNLTEIGKAMKAAGFATSPHRGHLDRLAEMGDIAIGGSGKTWLVYVLNEATFVKVNRALSDLRKADGSA